VLLVEDNVVNQKVSSMLLRQLGHEVVVAWNGEEAVRVAADGFDAVLMDCHMPVMDGFEATRLIRADPALERLPIYALTAASLPEERERCIAAGMDDVLVKPIDRHTLARVLHPLRLPAPALLTSA
jgi:CheY-like chemotaxis protein